MNPMPPVGESPTEPLTPLVYELLDAHRDTLDLADGLANERWRAHLDYLRALQRAGRELLARVDQEQTARSFGDITR
jgi:hypothetical protein